MTIFNNLLLVGYYIVPFAFYFALKNDENMFRIGWHCVCLVSIILNILVSLSDGMGDGKSCDDSIKGLKPQK